jgi:hypothetical protein
MPLLRRSSFVGSFFSPPPRAPLILTPSIALGFSLSLSRSPRLPCRSRLRTLSPSSDVLSDSEWDSRWERRRSERSMPSARSRLWRSWRSRRARRRAAFSAFSSARAASSLAASCLVVLVWGNGGDGKGRERTSNPLRDLRIALHLIPTQDP